MQRIFGPLQPIRFARMVGIPGLATAMIWALPARISNDRKLNLLAINGLITMAVAVLCSQTQKTHRMFYSGGYHWK